MSLQLGNTDGGNMLSLTQEERSRHIHVVGASGSGKSKLLESMIRDDIRRDRGLCLIDPHGSLADTIIKWCATREIDHRRVHFINPGNSDWSLGFNPIHVNSERALQSKVDAMVSTCAEVWGGEDTNQTPLLTTCLKLVFYALAANKMTLLEADELTAAHQGAALRNRLIDHLPDETYRRYWKELQHIPKREFEERFSSLRRRLLPFLGDPSIRRIIGQKNRQLDLQRVMDDGDVMIVNLANSATLSEDGARLLGALLLSELRLAAMSRDLETARLRPFSLYVDECYQYLTGDISKMLDQTRKFGLHTILSHQELGQLQSSKRSYSGVMGGAQTKIVFAITADGDAEVMAKEVFRSSFNLERPKHILDKPVITGWTLDWLESETVGTSQTDSASFSDTVNWSSSSGSSDGVSQNFGPPTDKLFGVDEPIGSTNSSGHSSTEGLGGGSSNTEGRSTTSSHVRGRSQTLIPVTEERPTALYSLDEQIHLAMVKLRELPNQMAILKRRGYPPIEFRPRTLKPPLAWPELAAEYIHEACLSSPYLSPNVDVDTEIALRQIATLKLPSEQILRGEEAFWTD